MDVLQGVSSLDGCRTATVFFHYALLLNLGACLPTHIYTYNASPLVPDSQPTGAVCQSAPLVKKIKVLRLSPQPQHEQSVFSRNKKRKKDATRWESRAE